MVKESQTMVRETDRKRAVLFGVIMLLIMVIVSSVSGYLSLTLQRNEENRFVSTIGTLLSESINRISFSGKYHTRLLLEELQKRLPEVTYISVETSAGVVEANTDSTKNGTSVDQGEEALNHQTLEKGTVFLRERTIYNNPVKEVILPYRTGIETTPTGIIRIGINVGEARKKEQNNLIFHILMIIVLAAISVWIMEIISRYFSRRLSLSEQALRESEERLRFLFKNSSDSLVILNSDGTQRYVSPAAERITGFPVAELEGRSFDTLIHPDDIKDVIEAWNEAVEHPEKTVIVQYRHIHKTLGWVYSEAIAQSFLAEPAIKGVIASVRDITERKHAEEALNNSNKLLNTIINTAPISIFFKDTELRYLGCNNAFAKDAGVESPEELIGKDDYQLVWKEQAELYRTDDLRIIKSGFPKLSYDEPQTTPEGNQIWLRTSKVPLRNEANEIIGVLGMYEDITERKISADTLRLRESYLSAIIENQPGLLWLKDTEGRFLAVNAQFAKSCGLNDPELLIGKTDLDIWPKDLAEKYAADDIKILRSRKPLIIEELISDKGEKKWFETFKTPIFDIKGVVIGSTGYARDITERRQAEDQLRESEDKFHMTFNFSPDAVSINRLTDGIYVDINEGFTKATGFSRDDVIGKTPLEINIWQNLADLKKVNQALCEEGILENLEAQFCRKDGSLVTGLISARVISIKGVPHIISTTHDITLRKEQEKELQKIEKLESLGLLAGGIAHDFNNILTGIIGNISLAKVFVDSVHKSYGLLTEAEKAAVRAGELAHQLLTFARGGEPIKKVVSLQHLVNEALTFILHGSNVKGVVDIPDSIHAFEADEGQMNQVFQNIIINATQAMPGGGILTVTARNEVLRDNNILSLPSGSYIRLTFTDQGCGISEDTLNKIFDPYFTTKSVGIGLGLSSVHSIISRHGGNIRANSVVGEGTTFTIHLPSIGKVYKKYQEDIAEHLISEHKGGRILVMDDEQMIREVASLMLTHLGYEVTTCANGEEAVELYKTAMKSEKPFLTAIMDLTIPGGLGGKEAAEQILSVYPQACLIVSSGYSNDPIISNYHEHGFSGTIAKPYSLVQFEKVLGTLFTDS